MVIVTNEVEPQLLNELNNEMLERYKCVAARDEEERRHRVALSQIGYDEAMSNAAIWRLINAHRGELLQDGRKSFTTKAGHFQLRNVPGNQTVTDSKSVMDVARKLGVVRNIATPPKNGWRFSKTKFFKWLKTHDENRKFFDKYLEDTPAHESLTLKPNEHFGVEYSSRLTSEPITVHDSVPHGREN